MRIDELKILRDRAACLRAESRNRADDFDTQKFDRDVRINRLLHGPTPLAADNRDPMTYIWAACFAPEDMPKVSLRTRWSRLTWRRAEGARRDIIAEALDYFTRETQETPADPAESKRNNLAATGEGWVGSGGPGSSEEINAAAAPVRRA